MDILNVIRGLYQAHLSEVKADVDAVEHLTGQFHEMIEKYVRLRIPNAVFDGEMRELLFDYSDSDWHNIDVTNAVPPGSDGAPFMYRVVERPGSNTCAVCHFINGKSLPFQLLVPGLTAPPFHPNCKGWVEVIDREGNVLFVIGRKPDYTAADATISDSLLDGIQFVIDLIGLIPLVGEPADGVNAIISLARGDMLDAALSAGSMIPFVGWTSAGGKWIKNIIKHSDEIADVAKYADEAAEIVDNVAKYGDELAESVGKSIDDVAEGAGKVLKPQNLMDELAQAVSNTMLMML